MDTALCGHGALNDWPRPPNPRNCAMAASASQTTNLLLQYSLFPDVPPPFVSYNHLVNDYEVCTVHSYLELKNLASHLYHTSSITMISNAVCCIILTLYDI